jgi:hypothetical protein
LRVHDLIGARERVIFFLAIRFDRAFRIFLFPMVPVFDCGG